MNAPTAPISPSPYFSLPPFHPLPASPPLLLSIFSPGRFPLILLKSCLLPLCDSQRRPTHCEAKTASSGRDDAPVAISRAVTPCLKLVSRCDQSCGRLPLQMGKTTAGFAASVFLKASNLICLYPSDHQQTNLPACRHRTPLDFSLSCPTKFWR